MSGAAPFTVAIDGPAAAGKGTIARAVAAAFDLAHLDTGLLYRAVGHRMLQGVEPIAAAESLEKTHLEDDALRTRDVAQAASKVAAIPQVRSALLDFQRAFARRSGGAVLDGRDIGTVIVPQAEAKLYVTATDQVRARRRQAELVARGTDVDFATVLEDVRSRDARDMERATAPLKPAEGALVLDTSELSIDDAVARAVAHVGSMRGGVDGI